MSAGEVPFLQGHHLEVIASILAILPQKIAPDVLSDGNREGLETAAGFEFTSLQWSEIKAHSRLVFADLKVIGALSAPERDEVVGLERACEKLANQLFSLSSSTKARLETKLSVENYLSTIGSLATAASEILSSHPVRSQGDRYETSKVLGLRSLKTTFLKASERCGSATNLRKFFRFWLKCLPPAQRIDLLRRSTDSFVSYVVSMQPHPYDSEAIAETYQCAEIKDFLRWLESSGASNLSRLEQSSLGWSVSGLGDEGEFCVALDTLYKRPLGHLVHTFISEHNPSEELVTLEPTAPTQFAAADWRRNDTLPLASYLATIEDDLDQDLTAFESELRSQGFSFVHRRQFARLRPEIGKLLRIRTLS